MRAALILALILLFTGCASVTRDGNQFIAHPSGTALLTVDNEYRYGIKYKDGDVFVGKTIGDYIIVYNWCFSAKLKLPDSPDTDDGYTVAVFPEKNILVRATMYDDKRSTCFIAVILAASKEGKKWCNVIARYQEAMEKSVFPDTPENRANAAEALPGFLQRATKALRTGAP